MGEQVRKALFLFVPAVVDQMRTRTRVRPGFRMYLGHLPRSRSQVGSRVGSQIGIRLLICLAGISCLSGCVTYMPVDEYNIARTAVDAAKDSDSARYAPALWFSTEQTYRDGQKAFDERDYVGARRLFIITREYAEKAENAAQYARHQSGDVVP